MKKLQLSLFLSFISISIFAQMRVIDPQNQWWDSDASIENVYIEVKPAGIFCETAITFDVKTTNSSFDNDTQLEYIYDFSMPENVVFNDSWLWIEDYISEGQIYEQSEGTAIYESIVDRQQDPSILTKYYNDAYNFRIYPLFNDSTRRVRLSYLVPFDNKNSKLESFLPMTFLKDSHERPQNVNLDITDDANWFHMPLTNSEWILTNNTEQTSSYTLADQAIITNQDVIFTSDAQDNYKLGIYEVDDTKYFQLMYEPEIEQTTTPTYNLILLDHETDNAYININEILPLLSETLNDLNEVDQFNILYHDFTSKFTGTDWKNAESSAIAQAITQVSEANTTSLSWLATLLPEALSYVENAGQNARIIIISADNNFYDEELSIDFLSAINNFISQMDTEVSISIIDYSKNRPGDWIGNQYYRGNEYLYNNLTQQHDGIYQISLSQGYMKSSLDEMFAREIDFVSEYDLDVENDFGFSYSKYFTGTTQKLRLDKPIMMTGKYIGEAPFRLEFNAFHNGTIIQEKITMTPNLELDKKAAEAWASQYILNNENKYDQDIISDVVDVSMEMGILSKHTVFLCLERDTSSISSSNGEDDEGGWTVDTEDQTINKTNINAFPNPFSENLNIEISSDLATNNDEVSVQILSIDGKIVYTFEQDILVKDGKIQLQWTPESSLDGGIYMIRVITESGVQTMKVMFLR